MNECVNSAEFTSSLKKHEYFLVLPYLFMHLFILPTLTKLLLPGVDEAALNVIVYGSGMAYMLIVGFRFLRDDFDRLYDAPLTIILAAAGAYIRMLIANYGVNDLIYRGFDIIAGERFAADTVFFAAAVLMLSPLLDEGFKAYAGRNERTGSAASVVLRLFWITIQLAALFTCVNDLAVRLFSNSPMNPNTEAISDIAGMNYGTVFGMAVFMAPIVEEMIFRAGLFGLVRKTNRIAAYAVSMAAFALYHLNGFPSGGQSWLFVLQYVPVSFLLCRSYEKTNCIWTSIFLHMTVNAVSMQILQMV